RALLMARGAGEPTRGGPAAVSVHDDRDVEQGIRMFTSTLHIKVSPEKKGSTTEGAAGRADDRLHVIEVALERPAASGGQPVFRLRAAALEGLGARHVLGVLELSGVDAQVPVGRLHQCLEFVEGERVGGRQGAQKSEPKPVMDEKV